MPCGRVRRSGLPHGFPFRRPCSLKTSKLYNLFLTSYNFSGGDFNPRSPKGATAKVLKKHANHKNIKHFAQDILNILYYFIFASSYHLKKQGKFYANPPHKLCSLYIRTCEIKLSMSLTDQMLSALRHVPHVFDNCLPEHNNGYYLCFHR